MCEYCGQPDWYCKHYGHKQITNVVTGMKHVTPELNHVVDNIIKQKATKFYLAMNKQEYFEFAEQFFNECIEISRKKNADYTGKIDNPFSNFSSVEVLGISTEHGFLTRMMDKFKRIASFVENGELQVKDESVMDTLKDLANYSCLLAGYIKSKK